MLHLFLCVVVMKHAWGQCTQSGCDNSDSQSDIMDLLHTMMQRQNNMMQRLDDITEHVVADRKIIFDRLNAIDKQVNEMKVSIFLLHLTTGFVCMNNVLLL